ncbi:MAG: helicase-associated domain-containing protein [Phototrophicaceae bacterium]
MQMLHPTLSNLDEPILEIIATVWGMKPIPNGKATLVDALTLWMLTPSHCEKAWDALMDEQRQALQTLIGSRGHMPLSMFARLFGEVRRMGRGGIEREQPHKTPQSVAEGLYYRGFISIGFEIGNSGAQPLVYLPEDFMLILPAHKTAYRDLAQSPVTPSATSVTSEPVERMGVLDEIEVEESEITRTNTAIVDDLTTVLAFLQRRPSPLEHDRLPKHIVNVLMPYLLVKDDARLQLIVGLGISAGMLTVEDGMLTPERSVARQWLASSRSQQVQQLVNTWMTSQHYCELWHVPDLYPERGGSLDNYDVVAVRRAMLDDLSEFAPSHGWFAIDDLIYAIKDADPDFQRPQGNYNNWYIKDREGKYLSGFESWDTVEGGLIDFVITGILYWLGLVDLAPDSARLTAYGRAAMQMEAWPHPNEDSEAITIQGDNTILASRKLSRIDRFQLARFTSWEVAPSLTGGQSYVYRLTPDGLSAAEAQGIEISHITAFIKRAAQLPNVPSSVEQLLQNWEAGEKTHATLETMVILRTTSTQVLDEIYNTPQFRQYLGARLGEMAGAVRRDKWEQLRDALGGQGIRVDWLG